MIQNNIIFWLDVDYDQWLLDALREWRDPAIADVETKIILKTPVPVRQSEIFDQLLEYLPPVFQKDNGKSVAFFLRCHKPFTFKIKDCFFQTFTENSFIPDLMIDLRDITIGELVEEILKNGDYLVEVNKHTEKSALCLIDSHHENSPNGEVYVFTNPLWGVFKAFSFELQEAYDAMLETQRQISMTGAMGFIEDYWGSFFDVERKNGETDARYSQRTIWTLKLPKSNNTGLELILQEYFGIRTRIVDLGYSASNAIMLMGDAATPIGHVEYPLYNPLESYESEPCTFGIYLLDRVLKMFSASELADLKDIVYEMKEAGTRPKLIWYGKPLVMLMGDVTTPMAHPDYPLWYGCEYKNGYSSMYL